MACTAIPELSRRERRVGLDIAAHQRLRKSGIPFLHRPCGGARGAPSKRFLSNAYRRGRRGTTVDEFGANAIKSAQGRLAATPQKIRQVKVRIDHGDTTMTSPTTKLRMRLKLCVALGMAAIIVLNAPRIVDAQGLVQGVQQGAREGNKAAGPVGGVLGGAIGGVVGVVTGVTGVITGKNGQPAPAPGQTPAANEKDKPADKDRDKQGKTAKAGGAKGGKEGAKTGKQTVVLTQQGEPQVTPEQIVANSD